MAADWEKLSEEITDDNILIAEVDCTSEKSEEVCEDNNVQGFPTLKFGDALSLEEYDGERDFEELLSFAKSSLKPTCSPRNVDLCSEDEKSVIDKFMAMSLEELEEVLEKVEDIFDSLDASLEKSTDELQEKYSKLMEQKSIVQKSMI
jgi:hypothetical protein